MFAENNLKIIHMTRKEAVAILGILLAISALAVALVFAKQIQEERIQDRIDNHSQIPDNGEN